MTTFNEQDQFDELYTLEAGNYERARGAHGTPSDGQIEMWVAADSRKDWHTIVAADIPALDASKITTGTLAIARGGTNIGSYAKGDTLYASATNVLSKLAGATGHDGWVVTWNDTTGVPEWRAASGGGGSGTLAGDTDVSITSPADRNLLIYHSSDSKWHNDTLVAGDVPSLDASKITTGTMATARLGSGSASSATFLRGDQSYATPGPTSGGTGFTTETLGDILYADASNSWAKLAGNTTSTKKFLRQTGTGSVSAAPAWDTLVAGDVPALDASKITTGTLAVAQGGTNIGSYTTGDLLYASSSSVLSKLAIGGTGKVLTVSGGLPVWTDVSGSGGGGVLPPYLAYGADTKPASANTEDDEFDSSTLDPKWTLTVNSGSPTTDVDTTVRSHFMMKSTATTNQNISLTQAFAATAFTVAARVRSPASAAGATARLFIADVIGQTNAWAVQFNGAGTVSVVKRVAGTPTTLATSSGFASGYEEVILYLQKTAANTWRSAVSLGGRAWTSIGALTTTTVTFTETVIGLQLANGAGFVGDRFCVDWFRRDWITIY